jgi:hypothetical protein
LRKVYDFGWTAVLKLRKRGTIWAAEKNFYPEPGQKEITITTYEHILA